MINWDQIEGNWKQLKGRVQEQWGKLTDDVLMLLQGKESTFAARFRSGMALLRKRLKKWLTNGRRVPTTHGLKNEALRG